ncbi:MAG: hypothetical protein CMI92_00165 [Pelagibacteraceae bacterium]|nr:hypothetical protein [Pelagibacteraceae bacterium]
MNEKNNNKKYLNSLLIKYKKGNKKEAISELEYYTTINPKDTLATYNLGVMYQETNQIAKSIEQYLKVIKKDKKNWKAYLNLGLQYFKKKDYQKSNEYYFNVLKVNKDYQPALRDIGTNYLLLNNYKKADEYLNRSIKLNPVDYICLNSLGVVKMRLDKSEDAKDIFERAISVNKDYYTSYNNLGLYYDRIGEKEKAFKEYKKCLKIEPNYPNALNNIGLIYYYYENNEKAFDCFFKALKIDPDMIDIYFNLAHTYFTLRKFEEAEKWFQKGFKMDPHNITGHYNYSFYLLALQQYKKAWIEYEYRLKKPLVILNDLSYENIKEKLWSGEKLTNQKLLVLREQGAGDEILYSSMYQDLTNINKNVVFETDPRLISLFKRSFKINFIKDKFYSKNDLDKFDKIIFAGSLGKFFRKNINEFPKRKNYLISNKEIVKKINTRLNKLNNNKKIGISWFSKNKRIGGGKSINLNEMKPILETKEATFINMQYDDHIKEINDFKNTTGIEIIDFKDIDKFNDFESLAGLIGSLDLFITVSNTTAHLAAALGKETWVMAPKNDSLLFYWNTGSNKTPWYSKVKIFPKINKWDETIELVKSNLSNWMKKN